MKKSELRKLYLDKRAELSVEAVAEASQRIASRFFEGFDLKHVSRLHTFIRIRRLNEIDSSLIYFKLWRDFPSVTTCAPRIDASGTDLDNLLFTEQTELVENSWGIREPVGTARVNPSEIDLVLVPLLCVDDRGNRLGYGQGFYDRLLSQCRSDCAKVGLSYFPPVRLIEDINERDAPLDSCITPDALFRF